MPSKSSDLPQKSLQIRQDDKFYSRLLSKEISPANSSFRVYYGMTSGSVPFLWESQPGTPKNTIPTATLPPLTPPPSYYSSPSSTSSKIKSSKSKLMDTILLRLTILRKGHAPPSPSVSLSSSPASSSSSSSSPVFSPLGSMGTHQRRRSSSSRLSFSSPGEDEESDEGSPTSTLCFRVRRGATGRLRGCHSIVNMKNTLLSIVVHGSNQGTAA